MYPSSWQGWVSSICIVPINNDAHVFFFPMCFVLFFSTENWLSTQRCHRVSETKTICTVTLASSAIWYRRPNPRPQQTGLALSIAQLCQPCAESLRAEPSWYSVSVAILPHVVYSRSPANIPGLSSYPRLVFCPQFPQRAGVMRDKPSTSF